MRDFLAVFGIEAEWRCVANSLLYSRYLERTRFRGSGKAVGLTIFVAPEDGLRCGKKAYETGKHSKTTG
jgi:hypothetical protein